MRQRRFSQHLLFTIIGMGAWVGACSTDPTHEIDDVFNQNSHTEHLTSTSQHKWKLVWADEFSGTSLNTNHWNYEVNCNGGGNNEQECYTQRPQNISLDGNGHLQINVIKENYQGKPYTSARINTQNKGDFTYGRFSIKAKVPCGQGLLASLWALPSNNTYGGWPTSGDLDIAKIFGEQGNLLHGGATFGQPWPNQQVLGGQSWLQSKTFCEDFHLYTMERYTDHITWLVDDVPYYTLTNTAANWQPAPHWPFDQNFFIILNVSMGGNLVEAVDSNITQAQMLVDFVHVWELTEPEQATTTANPNTTTAIGECGNVPQIPVVPGQTTAWSDEFNGTKLDTTKWNFEVNCSGGGNNEQECYTSNPENIFLDGNGFLHIKVIKETLNNKPYTSSRINTQGHADFINGHFESRLKIPCGQGFWPAFWLMPTDNAYGTWPTSGELDIMEILGGNPNTLYGTAHFGPPWPNQRQLGGQYTLPQGDFCEDFHVFALDRSNTKITWSVDGKPYYTLTANAGNWWPLPTWPYNQRFFFILNVAMGGQWPGNPDPSIQSGEMVVDYVRFTPSAQ